MSKDGPSKLDDPQFRTERARKAAIASNTGAGVIRRFLNALDDLTDEQVETVRRALPPVGPANARETAA
jgi:hypothetical protein